jgi:predicted O-methyltransferase YrrM
MTLELWTAVDHYLSDLVVQPDASLTAALEASTAAGLPPISVSPTQGKLLEIVARILGDKRILEIGTLGGYSSIWLARALPPGGRLVTIESDATHAEVARANIARAGFAEIVDVRVGLAIDVLPQIAADGSGPFDLIFIDADKPSIPEYFAWSLKLSRVGALIIIDNVVREGAVIDAASHDASVQGVRRLNDVMAAERRVSATVIQTVGSKGYDGFAVALVTRGE